MSTVLNMLKLMHFIFEDSKLARSSVGKPPWPKLAVSAPLFGLKGVVPPEHQNMGMLRNCVYVKVCSKFKW